MTSGFSNSHLFSHLQAILIFETKKVIILTYLQDFRQLKLKSIYCLIYGYTFSDFCNNHQKTNCKMLKKNEISQQNLRKTLQKWGIDTI